jgi:hypothetical protein
MPLLASISKRVSSNKMAENVDRVLVYFYDRLFETSCDEADYRKQALKESLAMPFSQSLINKLNSSKKKSNSKAGGNNQNFAYVTWFLKGHKLILCPTNDQNFGQSKFCLMIRPSFCPITHLSEEQANSLPQETISRGIATGKHLFAFCVRCNREVATDYSFTCLLRFMCLL